MSHSNLKFKELLSEIDVIPVMVINDINEAVPMAQDLVAKGYNVLEITLRTECALEAVGEILKHVPQAVVGVGTVTNPDQLEQARKVGAHFAVSPGFTNELIQAAKLIDIPLLPGVATAGEAMTLHAEGYRYLKLFPAEVVGGRAWLKSINGPLPDLVFCPTGGINSELKDDYLKLPNVICVGGSWMIK